MNLLQLLTVVQTKINSGVIFRGEMGGRGWKSADLKIAWAIFSCVITKNENRT